VCIGQSLLETFVDDTFNYRHVVCGICPIWMMCDCSMIEYDVIYDQRPFLQTGTGRSAKKISINVWQTPH
jgi:hypothetical protein